VSAATTLDAAQLRADDAAARALAVTVFDRPLAIEAGAGTGKTTTLVGRIATWCLGPGWERAGAALEAEGTLAPDDGERARRTARGVFAITFTIPAAAEMAARAGKVFAQVASGDTAKLVGVDRAVLEHPDAARRAAALLGAVDLLEIGTIHAFCGRILRDQALALGLHPAFRIDADGTAIRAVARRVVARRWPALLDAGDADALSLAARGVGASDVVGGVVALAAGGTDASALDGDPFAPVAGLLDAFDARADALLRLIEGAEWKKNLKKPEALRAALFAWAAESGDDAEPLTRRARAVELFDAHLAQLDDWNKGKIQKGVQETVDPVALARESAAFRVASQELLGYDPERFGAAARVLAPLLDATNSERRREGWLSFDDLLELAGRWARRSDGVGVSQWRARIDQLLVDEFQDTDARQCDLVRGLALDGPPDERPGLFVVGDPKQSIYGWRAADLASYEGLLDDLVAAGGTRHALSVNYRSNQDVLDEVGRVLAPHLVHEAGVQAAYEPLVVPEGASFDDPIPGTARVEHWTSWSIESDGSAAERTSSARVSALEARCVARDILAARAADPELDLGEVGLLMRSTSDQDVVLRALREAGIPFAVARERSFWHHREVRDAQSALRCVLDPTDEVALVAWLRSPHTALPDAALAGLWRASEPGADDGLATLLAEVDGPAHPHLAHARERVQRAADALAAADLPVAAADWAALVDEQLERLAHLRAAFERDDLARFLGAARRAAAAEAGEAARTLGRFRTANLDAFWNEFERRAIESDGDRVELLRFLRAEREESPDTAPSAVVGGAVQVMTIHASKGLEFRLVYLLHGHKRATKRGSNRRGCRVARDDEGFHFDLFGAASARWKAAERRAERVGEAERARLLYVALTRAAERLVVCATADPDKLAHASDPPVSFSEYLADRRPLDLATRLEECARQVVASSGAAAGGTVNDGTTDEDGVRWRVPSAALAGTAANPDTRAAAATDGPPAPDPRRAAADAAVLDAARARAQALARRPAARAASDGLPERGDADGAAGRDGFERAVGADARRDASELGRDAAALVGTAVHAVLSERVETGADDAAWDRAATFVGARASSREARAALERLDDLRRALEAGPLLARLDAARADAAGEGRPRTTTPSPPPATTAARSTSCCATRRAGR